MVKFTFKQHIKSGRRIKHIRKELQLELDHITKKYGLIHAMAIQAQHVLFQLDQLRLLLDKYISSEYSEKPENEVSEVYYD